MTLKFETMVQIFRKIMQLIAVVILKNTNEYHQKMISKSGGKMNFYPAMGTYQQEQRVHHVTRACHMFTDN